MAAFGGDMKDEIALAGNTANGRNTWGPDPKHGHVMPVKATCEMARARGIITLVDGDQGAGRHQYYV